MSNFDHGIPKQVTLDKNRVIFEHGHRVDDVIVSNKGSTFRYIEVAAYNSSFYFPPDAPKHVGRTEIHAPSYFYLGVGPTSTEHTGPFFARRGLVLKNQGAGGPQVSATVVVAGVSEGGLLSGRE